jgi:hypothetical protein
MTLLYRIERLLLSLAPGCSHMHTQCWAIPQAFDLEFCVTWSWYMNSAAVGHCCFVCCCPVACWRFGPRPIHVPIINVNTIINSTCCTTTLRERATFYLSSRRAIVRIARGRPCHHTFSNSPANWSRRSSHTCPARISTKSISLRKLAAHW